MPGWVGLGPLGGIDSQPIGSQQGYTLPPNPPLLTVYPRNGSDTSNYFSAICPNCGNIHHLYSLAVFVCNANGQSNQTRFQPVPNLSDLGSGDYLWLAYGANLFVGLGSNFVGTSWDGQIWTPRVIPAGNWQTVVYGGPAGFVAGGYSQWNDGIISTSIDGIAWASQPVPAGVGQIQYLIWTGSQYVGVGLNTAVTSADGKTWTKRTIPNGVWGGVQYNGSNLYVAIGYDGRALTSPDAVTWTLQTGPGGTLQDIVYAGGKWTTIGYGSACFSTTDGVTWTKQTIAAGDYIAIRHDGTNYIAVGNSVLATSTNGTAWTAQTIPAGFYVDLDFQSSPSFVYAIVGLSAATATSTSLTAWTKRVDKIGWDQIDLGKIVES